MQFSEAFPVSNGMDILGKIFGSQARVRIIRLFLFNPERVFDNREVGKRIQATVKTVAREARLLKSGGLIKKKTATVTVRRRGAASRRTKQGWTLNIKFPYLAALQNLVINTVLLKDNEIIERLSGTGHIKFLVAAGVFIQDLDSRVDLLVVGDRLKKTLIEGRIKKMESEIGRELRYSIFETPDFQYRVSIYDKLVRDILEFPHRTVVDKIGIRAPFTPLSAKPREMQLV